MSELDHNHVDGTHHQQETNNSDNYNQEEP